MSSTIKLKNTANTELTISHEGTRTAKSMSSTDIAVAIDTINDFPTTPTNGDVVIVRDLNRGGTFIYDSTEVVNSNDGTNFSGWIRQYSGAVNVKWFGAKGDGIADDTTAIQNTVNYVAIVNSASAKVYLPEGNYLVSDTININEHNVFLEGEGQGGYSSGILSLRDSARTRIFANSLLSSGVAIVEYRTPAGTVSKSGGGVSKIMIDCMNIVGIGLNLVSWSSGSFSDICVYGATNKAISLTTTSEVLAAEPYDCYKNTFHRIFTTTKNLAGNVSHSLYLDKDPSSISGNSCFNTFTSCNFTSVILGDTDNNMFFSCSVGEFVFSSADQTLGGVSRYNMVSCCQANITAKSSQTGGASSHDNVIYGLNQSNGKGIVTIEPASGGSEEASISAYYSNGTMLLQKGESTGTITSNKLKSYEEGTFVVEMGGTLTDGTCTYIARVGTYTRIGNMVKISIKINYTALTATGDLVIRGLPYTSTNTAMQSMLSIKATSLTFSGQLTASVPAGSDYIALESTVSGIATSAVAVDVASNLWISGTYEI